MKWRLFHGFLTFAAMMLPASAGVRYWRKADGGNGHGYEVVMFGKTTFRTTWDRARKLAEQRGGYLATVTSKEENDFILKLIKKRKYWHYLRDGYLKRDFWDGPWIGGYQVERGKEPGGGWKWLTGEPFSFDGWYPGLPDDGFGGQFEQNCMHYWASGRVKAFKNIDPKWDDVGYWTYWIPSFVVEYEPKPTAAEFFTWPPR